MRLKNKESGPEALRCSPLDCQTEFSPKPNSSSQASSIEPPTFNCIVIPASFSVLSANRPGGERKSRMIRRPKSLPVSIYRLGLRRCFQLEQLRSKSSRRYRLGDGERDGDMIRKPKEDREGKIRLLKSRGQHILTNRRVLDSIVHNSDVKPTDTVLEVGPGTGNLTLRLLEAAETVVAIEIDRRMVEILRGRAEEGGLEDRLKIIGGDALKTEFPRFDLVVANIPYGISSPLVAKFVFGANPFRSATLLLQKEFARRLLANPGDSEYNRLAANVKLVANVEFIMDVSKRDFVPCPKVDSSVVKIWRRPEIPDIDLHEWLAFTRTCFSKKNKTLGATFKKKKKVIELYRLSTLSGSNGENTGNCYSGDSSHDEEEEDEESAGDEAACSLSEMEMNLFRENIVGILKSSGFHDKRPSKLCNEELLDLLFKFNQAGIWFQDRVRPRDAAFTASYGP
ncbi:ribosomal RNA small subunit methyltransferase, mitochondrial-like [Diospyros lotus]|uniref:ribosomal RNA small subunit methyltransferase, mitochondrial-like n=1 Tax=Diospyros lotus TaxID=55363 RepID=UPI002254D579|nr:ribosomal RNA small subunit methyltransferase, mitochondrial-like [Diospyros lotus]